jgi:hypothetical protein
VVRGNSSHHRISLARQTLAFAPALCCAVKVKDDGQRWILIRCSLTACASSGRKRRRWIPKRNLERF